MERNCFISGLIILLITLLMPQPAMADWADVSASVSVVQDQPVVDDNGAATIRVTVKNVSTENVEGELRLLVTTSDGTPAPTNATGTMGEDGQTPTPYYIIPTGQELLFEPSEIAVVYLQFSVASPVFTLSVQVNDDPTESTIFRKKISKTPEFVSMESGIEIMDMEVEARNSKGEKLCMHGDDLEVCSDGENPRKVRPIIITYAQEVEDTAFNSVPDYMVEDENGNMVPGGERLTNDIYVAVSYDEGATWKRKNISRTSGKSSFNLENGCEYPGDSEKGDMVVDGPYVFVSWVDKFCRSGNPWNMPDDWEDPYQVMGPQRSVDYMDVHGDDEPRPDLGQRPFSCVWGARGVLNQDSASPDFGTIVWYSAEQLSTGRRDAYRNFPAAIAPTGGTDFLNGPGGFGISWQEDRKGLKTGKGRGPGAGMSGACVNHKTDIWYSFISWDKFAEIDTDFVPSEGGDDADPSGDDGGNTQYDCSACGYIYDPETGDPDHGVAPGTKFAELPENWTCPNCGADKALFTKDSKPHAKHMMAPPVRITDNAVCRDRIPEDVEGMLHDPDISENNLSYIESRYPALFNDPDRDAKIRAIQECDYTYEGGTSKQPQSWLDLPDDWVCPQCGATKDTFVYGIIKTKHEGYPYCDQYKDNPRVDKEGNYVSPDDITYDTAYYCAGGGWVKADDPGVSLSGEPSWSDGKVFINGTQVVWSGEPLDGDTGASRANLSLVNWEGETLAVIAYEETKGEGSGSDKEAEAMEQKTPVPIMVELDGAGDVTEILQGPYPNSFCISCHYDNVVPVERLIPVFDRNTCENEKGGKWKEYVTGYWPYSPYPPTDGISPDELDLSASNCTHCVKFEEGKKICTQESLEPDCEYTVLPNSLPGWHTPTLNCSGCHLPWGTKDLDLDSVADRFDKCPGTNEGEAVDSASTSETYGCSADQDPDAVTDEEVKKERHGKHLFYHNFTFDNPVNEAISHGYRVNQKNSKDKFENARRVRVVPQTLFDDRNKGEQITLGLFYKQGENGQGAPADAFLQVFKGGFSPENIVTHHLENRDGEVVSRKALNLSSSRPLAYKELELPWLDSSGIPTSVNTGVANPDYDVDQSGHKTPKVVKYEWDNANLADESGWKLPETDADGNPVLDEAGEPVIAEDEYGIPRIRCNPYENVFSTRLSIRGDFILTAYAYCVNWAAGKKAKDHYDFFARWSLDGGQNWTLPANVSQLKNHSESVADCRILQPDSDTNEFFVAVGTKENTPQPNPNVTELEEAEVFLDLFYSKAEKQSDGKFRFGAITKKNPKYEEGALPYVNLDGEPTSVSGTYQNDIWIDYDENPAYPETVEEFDWLAKGDAFQGDVQVQCSPDGEKLFTVWEQELEIDESDSQTHFQGADIWFRKVLYPDPTIPGDLDNDQVVDATDRGIIMAAMNTTPDSSGWVGKADYDEDQQITYNDYRQWYIHYKAFAAQ